MLASVSWRLEQWSSWHRLTANGPVLSDSRLRQLWRKPSLHPGLTVSWMGVMCQSLASLALATGGICKIC